MYGWELVVSCPGPLRAGGLPGFGSGGEGWEGPGTAEVRILGIEIQTVAEVALAFLDETQLALQIVTLIVPVHGDAGERNV